MACQAPRSIPTDAVNGRQTAAQVGVVQYCGFEGGFLGVAIIQVDSFASRRRHSLYVNSGVRIVLCGFVVSHGEGYFPSLGTIECP